ncbi:MAG: gliding motility-associated protein GldE [Chitinophagaceae bacterium]|nr:gliding motility-associated protein GldE [Chitinophagaceae bacterium]
MSGNCIFASKQVVLETHSVLISQLYQLFHLLYINPKGTSFLVIILLILLLLAFTISGAEVALFSLGSKDINMLKTKNNPGAKRIVTLLEEPKEVYASLLISGTFVNISIIVLLNYLLTQFITFNDPGGMVEVIIKVLIIAFVLVFIGKIFPKVWAAQNNLRFAYGSAVVVEAIHLLLRRISRWTISLADGIGKKAGADRSQAMSIKELDEAIDIKSDEEASQDEKNIMKGIVKFGNISVRQIMKSRLDVSGVDHSISFGELIKKVEELHYTRLPIYRQSLDDVLGLINTKDLIPHLDEGEQFNWHSLIRPPFFVPETKLIEDLLKEFQQKRVHFAVVVDEFGGTSGIVTMEDILEEIIGEIKDEFDEDEVSNRKIDDHNYLFEGRTMINDACRIMNIPRDTFDPVRGDSESIGGLVLELAGEFPAERSTIRSGDFEFTIIEKDNNRILQVQVSIKPMESN